MGKKRTLRWMRLDNAAKIYPAARRRNWSNVFRLSATLTEEVDQAVLQSALDVTVLRFPSMAARLRRGAFWYYLQELEQAPRVREEYSYPLTPMSKEEVSACAIRVIAWKNRIAVEYFHSLTDGNGALVFLKTLTAEYLQQKYGIAIANTHGILDRTQPPSEQELEDSFLKYAAPVAASRAERTAWHLSGTPDSGNNLICFSFSAEQLLEKAHEYDVTATVFLCAAMIDALQNMQKDQIPERKKRKPIRVLIPVNLRKLFPSKTLRNFALYTTPEILPKLGDYGFEEICAIIKNRMAVDIDAKQMSMKIATNVDSERLLAVKLMPLFIKNAVMKAIFNTVGETKSCLTMSNLGAVKLPEEMARYVERLDFILGVQASAPYNCGVVSYDGTVRVNFIRNIKEAELERQFFRVLQQHGICVQVQSAGGERN